ncbi:SDR family NAD(P)-dependent oxidoreductase [Tropicimonas sediminicola]|uniref:SDR family NAD(P)-dependent oxidoreductase n=1 Tax=Tropicimonas sediminicola TaxID=1031541 RepID=UPI002481C6D5|nr:SDR family NAD(P)-dependent oxidoreductase [Tropicimonas sediminicola]
MLVTGADGFIGSHLVEALVATDANVTALCMYNSFDSLGWIDDIPASIRGRINVARGDVRDAAFVRNITAQQDTVFHLAALIAIPHSYVAAQSYVDTNVLGTLNVLEAAREHDVRRVVVTSTSEVYGTAQTVPIAETHPLQGQSPYSASKIGADMIAESFARSHDLPVVILRPFNTFGPRQSERAVIPTVIRQALDPQVDAIRIGDLTPVRDFTFVSDTAAAFVTAGTATRLDFGVPYNAGTGRAVTIGEVVDLLRTLTKCDKPIVQETCRIRPPKSEVRELLADSRRFQSATGWSAKVELRDGLAQAVAWWQARVSSGSVRRETSYAT